MQRGSGHGWTPKGASSPLLSSSHRPAFLQWCSQGQANPPAAVRPAVGGTVAARIIRSSPRSPKPSLPRRQNNPESPSGIRTEVKGRLKAAAHCACVHGATSCGHPPQLKAPADISLPSPLPTSIPIHAAAMAAGSTGLVWEECAFLISLRPPAGWELPAKGNGALF